jgi:hypothetical protein
MLLFILDAYHFPRFYLADITRAVQKDYARMFLDAANSLNDESR